MELVSPIIPDGNKSKAPELFLQAMGQGLQAFSRMAEMRRQSEMDMLKLAEHERLSQEQFALEKEKMSQDFDIRQATLDSTRTLNEAHAEYYRAGAAAYADGTKTAAQRAIAFNQQRQALVTDVNDQAARLQLDDPNFATKEPVQFAANMMQFEDMFSLSPLPEVKNAISVYRRTADQQKIPIKMGAKFDEEAKTWSGGETKTVPIWQVVKNLQNPDTKEQTLNDLKASGHINSEEETVPGKKRDFFGAFLSILDPSPSPQKYGRAWEKLRSTPDTTRTVDKSTDVGKRIIKESSAVEFKRVPSRVAPAMLPKGAAGGTTPTELPEPDSPADMTDPQASAQPVFEPTETDKMLEHAKVAIAKGAPMPMVAQRLTDLGIDPTPLWAS